jgi:AcrR family transcriptional regulator
MDEGTLEPRKRPIQTRSRATVDALVEATARVLVQDGPNGTSTNRIAEVAGVSVGSLYQYFPNKEALVVEVARRHSERMIAMLEQFAQDFADVPVEQAVRTYVRAMFAVHGLDPGLHAALLPYYVNQGIDRFAAFNARVLAVVRAWLERHRHEVLPCDLDAASAVLVIAVESATHASFVPELSGVGPSAVEAEVTDLVLRYLLGATAAGPASSTAPR